MEKHALLFTSILLITLCLSTQAEVYIPANDTVVIKTSLGLNHGLLSIEQLESLVNKSQLIGQSEQNQGLLKRQLRKRYQQQKTAKNSYLYARVLQREHQFSASLEVLNTLLLKYPNQVNARLLQANTLMVQGNFIAAKNSCLSLLGHSDLKTISICALDAQSQEQQLEQSYKTLALFMVKRDKHQNDDNSSQSQWGYQVLAEMALRLNQPVVALKYFESVSLPTAPVSLITLWADIQLSLGNIEQVLQKLPILADKIESIEDSLLLRLAIAELTTTEKKWQNMMEKRVKLREIRQDSYHAADLARYYLDVKQEPEKAKYWAKINWSQAKMANDKALLARAITFHKVAVR